MIFLFDFSGSSFLSPAIVTILSSRLRKLLVSYIIIFQRKYSILIIVIQYIPYIIISQRKDR